MPIETNCTSTSPFLTGVFAPVDDELDVADLKVVGQVPEELHGSYLRNGPNPAFTPIGRYHLFDGDGMIHGVELEGGRARYRNRWVVSRGLAAERKHGRALFGGLSEFKMPDDDIVAEAGMMKNTSNTHLVQSGNRLLSLMEASRPIEITGDLTTVGEWDFGGKLHGGMTAHPKIDPVTGDLIFFGYSPVPPYLRLHVADAAGDLVHSREIDLPAPVMMHDFAVSAEHIIFFDLPAVFDLQAMFAGGAGIRWDPSNGARIGIVDRADFHGDVQWIEVDPFYVFHFLNAHDEDGTIVVTGCRSDRLNVGFGGDEVPETVKPHLHRWRIGPATARVENEPLDDRPGDFPRINDGHTGLPTRYGYVAQSGNWNDEAVLFDGIIKHDLESGTSTTLRYGEHVASGEAAFAADPTRPGIEDGGWLLNFVHDLDTDTSALAICDAASLEETARIELPRRVPMGFHGSWFPGR